MARITIFYIFLSSLFTALLLIPPISRLAVTIGMMDRTDERKVHVGEIPRLGGIAIFFSFLLTSLTFFNFDQQTRGFFVGAVVIFLIGLADDLVGLSPRRKLAGQFIAAVAAIVMGNMHLESLGNLLGFGEVRLGFFAVPFTIFAVVGVMNAINLLDGLDGLAGGVTAICCIAFGILGFLTGNVFVMTATAALVGAVLGFLKYNTHPASIFMGDSGSLFLGYCLGVISVAVVVRGGDHVSEVTPLMILSVPIVDTLYVMIRRKLKGKAIFTPDRSHLHHRVMSIGFTHKATVICVYALTYLMATAALMLRHVADSALLAVVATMSITFYIVLDRVVRNREKLMLLYRRRPDRGRINAGRRSLVQVTGYLRRGIKYALIGILLLTVLVPCPLSPELSTTALFLLALSVALLFMTHDWGNRFLRFVLYLDGAFIIYQMENRFDGIACLDLPVRFYSNILFAFLFILVMTKVVLRKRTRDMMNSPLEYLVIFPMVSVPLLPPAIISEYHLLAVAAKSSVLFASYKLILMRQANRNRKIIVATLVALLAFSLKRYL